MFSGCKNVEFELNFIVDNSIYYTIDTSGQEVISLPENPQKEGFIFDGWYWDYNIWSKPFTANSLLNEPLNSDMSVYARWIDDNTPKGTQANFKDFLKTGETNYSISIANNIETLNMSNIVEVSNQSEWVLTTDIQGNNSIASKIATLNIGDNTYYVLVTSSSNDVCLYTLKIRRRPIYTVSFGEYAQTQYIEEDGYVIEPPTPERKGYIFDGWLFNFNTKIVSNTTVEAKWLAKKYNITYHSNYSTSNKNVCETNEILFDSIITLDNNIFKYSGYILSSWNTKSDGSGKTYSSTFRYILDTDLELYAQWSLVNYKIKYYIDGNLLLLTNNKYKYINDKQEEVLIDKEFIGPDTFNIETNDIRLNVPNISKKGYYLNNWETNDGIRVDIIEQGSFGDIVLNAKWAPQEYTINYETYGIEIPLGNPTTYNIESSTIDLITGLYRDYYTTWINDNGVEILNIQQGSVDNINLSIALKDENGLLYKIIDNFSKLKNIVPDGNYVIINDINCNNEQISNSLISSFTGVFDGNNMNITNINVSTFNQKCNNLNFGLFCQNYGVIKNLNLVNLTINSQYRNSDSLSIGSIVGYNNGILENCTIQGIFNIQVYDDTSITSYLTIGGIVGKNNSILKNIKSNISLNTFSNNYTVGALYYTQGGLCGVNTKTGIIESSGNYGNITAEINQRATQSSIVGGICGHNEGEIRICLNKGEILSKITTSYPGDRATIAAGISGENYGVIKNCYSNANVTAYTNCRRINAVAGGICGYGMYGEIINCYSIGLIIAQGAYGEYCINGGISGNAKKIENCFTLSELQVTDENAFINAICTNYSVNCNIINSYYSNNQKYYNISTECYFNISTNENSNLVNNVNFLQADFVKNTLKYGEFISQEDFLINDNNVWVLKNDSLPKLFWE